MTIRRGGGSGNKTASSGVKTQVPGGSASASSAGKMGAASAPEIGRGGGGMTAEPLRAGGESSQAYKAANEAILSYMGNPKDRRKQEALLRQMEGFNNALDQALARAMAPKSKRQQMLEKYVRNSGPQALKNTGGGPFAGVVGQISSQKESVVNSVADSFGEAAGQKAGKLMDSFRQEAQAVANNPQLGQQEKADALRKVNNKYQGLLGNLVQNESLNKMGEEQRQENEAYLALLRDKFNSQTADAARPILEDFAAKKMELMKQGLPAPQFQEAYLKLKQEADDKVKQAVFDVNPTRPDVADVLEEVNRQSAQEQLEKDEAAVEAGVKRDDRVVVSQEVKQKYQENFAQQREKDKKEIERVYGPEIAAEFVAIDEAYEKEVLENFDSQEGRLSVNKKNQAAVEKRNQAVSALLEKAKNDPEIKKKQVALLETEIKKQTEKTLSQIMQSEEMRKWPSSAKKSYETQARAIFDDMAKQMAQAAVDNADNPAQYEAEAKRIEQQAQQRLQNIQVAVPAQEQQP